MRFTLSTLTASASSAVSLLVVALALSAPTGTEAAALRGAPYGADSRWSSRLFKGKIQWYHHWQDGPISGAPGYVPTFWGPAKWDKWNQRKQEMNRNLPTRLLAFNEPDIKSQANMDPQYAAQVYAAEICPWQRRGVKVSTPQIVWDYDGWMDPFLRALRARSDGCEPDFLAIHWYGRKNEIEKLKAFVRKGHAKYNKYVWITEMGLMSSSGPDTGENENFLRAALKWIDSQDYVTRVTWTGVFPVDNPPDSFLSRFGAMFRSDGSLRSLAYIMQYE
ncbi:hypothetical protein V8E36_007229 [Tilletia maclaganii]